ncbi:MAG TPA: carbohydrate kinase family protein [Candidatus Kaiserbacteria bacterium]|nr:carbohydrate kinase family protein [Candidatus Kaiserbacteria bacterium]
MQKQLDFIAIGDIVVDNFIKLKEAEVHCAEGTEECTISMRWGDKIPFKSSTPISAVGNSPNAAVASARLGLSTGLMVWMGEDRLGDECMDVLVREGIDTSLVSRSNSVPTNAHYVLSFQAERTILIKHNEFPYRFPEFPAPSFLYLSSLAPSAGVIHDALFEWLPKHPETKLIFQPGTFQIEEGTEALAPIYKNTYLFVCNKEEAELILGYKKPQDFPTLLSGIASLGPKIVIITDGPDGAVAFDGSQMLHVPMYPDSRAPIDRTGAGDAFTSTVGIALALGKPLHEALLWGPVNSMSVVQALGAQAGLLSRQAIESYLESAPAEYRVTKYSE